MFATLKPKTGSDKINMRIDKQERLGVNVPAKRSGRIILTIIDAIVI